MKHTTTIHSAKQEATEARMQLAIIECQTSSKITFRARLVLLALSKSAGERKQLCQTVQSKKSGKKNIPVGELENKTNRIGARSSCMLLLHFLLDSGRNMHIVFFLVSGFNHSPPYVH